MSLGIYTIRVVMWLQTNTKKIRWKKKTFLKKEVLSGSDG